MPTYTLNLSTESLDHIRKETCGISDLSKLTGEQMITHRRFCRLFNEIDKLKQESNYLMEQPQPRPITNDLLDQFEQWTRMADMFRMSPEGLVFAEEMRGVINLARIGLLYKTQDELK